MTTTSTPPHVGRCPLIAAASPGWSAPSLYAVAVVFYVIHAHAQGIAPRSHSTLLTALPLYAFMR